MVCMSAAIVVLQKRKVSHARLWGIERRRSLARRGMNAEVELSTVAAFRPAGTSPKMSVWYLPLLKNWGGRTPTNRHLGFSCKVVCFVVWYLKCCELYLFGHWADTMVWVWRIPIHPLAQWHSSLGQNQAPFNWSLSLFGHNEVFQVLVHPGYWPWMHYLPL